MSKSMSLHFVVEGKGFLELVRQVYWYEDQERGRKLMESIPAIKEEQWIRLMRGELALTGVSVCDDWKNCHQCKNQKPLRLSEPKAHDRKFKKQLWDEGLLDKEPITNKFVVVKCLMKDQTQIVKIPLEKLLIYTSTIDRMETTMTIRRYHGELDESFVKKMDVMKLKAHEQLFDSFHLSHSKAHLEDIGYVECYVQEAIEKFWQEMIHENKQIKSMTVKGNKGKTFLRDNFEVKINEYFIERPSEIPNDEVVN